jgi:membrane protein involved in colicin uptake
LLCPAGALSAVAVGLALWPVQSLAASSEPAALAVPSQTSSETWGEEGARRAAEEAPRLEAEREARHAEEVERPAKEAAEKAAHEREVREAGERARREAAERADREAAERGATPHRERCVVPRLRGDSLTAAQRALHKAHCELGRVAAPRAHRGALIVGGQSVRAGRTLAGGTKVAVTLAPKRS